MVLCVAIVKALSGARRSPQRAALRGDGAAAARSGQRGVPTVPDLLFVVPSKPVRDAE